MPTGSSVATYLGTSPRAAMVSSSFPIRLGALSAEDCVLRTDGLAPIVAESPAMRAVMAVLERTAQSGLNVLITGERGAGKEMLTRWLHGMSAKAQRPLVVVRGGFDANGSLGDALFGHPNGNSAPTGRPGCLELAAGGTLFLNGICALGAELQERLLAALTARRDGPSEGERLLNVRIVTATHADPAEEIRAGRLSQGLFDVLAGSRVHLPSLRDRREDIPVLATHTLGRIAAGYGRVAPTFEADAPKALGEYSWPGNVRELEHAVERAVLLAKGGAVAITDLGLPLGEGVHDFGSMTLSAVERVLIQKALQRHEGNVSRTARSLGLSRSALYRRLHRHGI
jgi:DNA-binding NtrC family response regulator